MSWLESLVAVASRMAGTRGAVLCLHGLDVDGQPSPSSMHISLDHLDEILQRFGAIATVVPLQEIVTRHLAGRSTAGMVSFTADDAYASWLPAEALLQRHAVPLTLFAVGQALERGPTFWWDRIDEAALRSSPERWLALEREAGLPESYRIGHPPSEGRTRAMRQWVLAEHAGRCPASLSDALSRVEQELGKGTAQRAMTESELSGFLSRTGAQVGVHTASHAALPFLSDGDAVREVAQGYESLRSRFEGALPYLAIPFGLFDERTLRLAREAGMAASFNLEGQALDQPFVANLGIPRICVVREQSPQKLTLKASSLAGTIRRLRGQSQSSYPALPSPTS